MDSPAGAGPVFLVGLWRSGTSLLHALLNQHSGIGLLYEAELPLLRPLFPGGRAQSDWTERWEFWNAALSRHRIDPAAVHLAAPDLPTATKTAYRQFAAQKGASIWGEKSPNYWDRLDRVADAFPGARFIVLWRDPTAICRSVRSAAQGSRYFAKRGMLLRALLGCRKLKTQGDQLAGRGLPVHQLQYEELVRDPAAALREICAFLGIPFEPRMATLQDADRTGFYEGRHHSLAKGDRIVSAAQRPEILPPEFKRKIGRYVALWREEFGGQWPLYPPVADPPGPQPGPFERLRDALLLWLLRKLDQAIVFIYCRMPLRLLRAYRARRHST